MQVARARAGTVQTLTAAVDVVVIATIHAHCNKNVIKTKRKGIQFSLKAQVYRCTTIFSFSLRIDIVHL